jgi:hypothetical protein
MDRDLHDALDEEESKEFELPWCLGRWGTGYQRMVEQRGTNDWWRRGRMGAELPSTALWHGRGRNSQLTYLYVLAPPLEPSAISTWPEPSATSPRSSLPRSGSSLLPCRARALPCRARLCCLLPRHARRLSSVYCLGRSGFGRVAEWIWESSRQWIYEGGNDAPKLGFRSFLAPKEHACSGSMGAGDCSGHALQRWRLRLSSTRSSCRSRREETRRHSRRIGRAGCFL